MRYKGDGELDIQERLNLGREALGDNVLPSKEEAIFLYDLIQDLQSEIELGRRVNKDLYKLQKFLQANSSLSKHRYGESVSLIALDALKELQQENKRLNMIIGKYAGKMSDIATLNDAISKEIRKISSEMIMS